MGETSSFVGAAVLCVSLRPLRFCCSREVPRTGNCQSIHRGGRRGRRGEEPRARSRNRNSIHRSERSRGEEQETQQQSPQKVESAEGSQRGGKREGQDRSRAREKRELSGKVRGTRNPPSVLLLAVLCVLCGECFWVVSPCASAVVNRRLPGSPIRCPLRRASVAGVHRRVGSRLV